MRSVEFEARDSSPMVGIMVPLYISVLSQTDSRPPGDLVIAELAISFVYQVI